MKSLRLCLQIFPSCSRKKPIILVGVISPLDSDFEAAQQLGARLVTQAPFAPISRQAYEANLDMMSQSDAVVICKTPFGSGNLANLEAALELNDKSKIYILGLTSMEERDFTSGKATKIMNKLVETGAVPVKGIEQLKGLLFSRVPSG